jgi:hypothetical protein
MARKRQRVEEQGSLFGGAEPRRPMREAAGVKTGAAKESAPARRQWRMPQLEGKTVAEIRLRWPKRLTPAQVARVEAELSLLPKALTKLGFGAVAVERAFVQRRRS